MYEDQQIVSCMGVAQEGALCENNRPDVVASLESRGSFALTLRVQITHEL